MKDNFCMVRNKIKITFKRSTELLQVKFYAQGGQIPFWTVHRHSHHLRNWYRWSLYLPEVQRSHFRHVDFWNKINKCFLSGLCVKRREAKVGRPASDIWTLCCAAKKQYRKFETNIPRKGIAQPQSPFPHSWVSLSDFYISTVDLPILLQENMWTDPENYKSLNDTRMLKLGLRPRNSQKRYTKMGLSLQCVYFVLNSCLKGLRGMENHGRCLFYNGACGPFKICPGWVGH
jgi:hypothetical protein